VRLQTNNSQYDIPLSFPARSDRTCYEESLRLWNEIPEACLELDKKHFYDKVKLEDPMAGITAGAAKFQLYNLDV
jgi:hypothetical protein